MQPTCLAQQRFSRVPRRVLENGLEERRENLTQTRPGWDSGLTKVVPVQREVAKVEGPHFAGIDGDVLERTIAFYQQLGNWARSPEIPRDAYEVALDVFAHSGLITRRHAYDAVVVPPPGS